MLEEQTKALTTILRDNDLQQYMKEAIWDLIEAVTAKDPCAALSAGKNIRELIYHMPTIIFWDKMKRFLIGTFHNFEDQKKMVQKFDKNNKKYEYEDFVKHQIHLINTLDEDLKIDYFAKLTRRFLLADLDKTLYFKMCKFLSICTLEELVFLENCDFNFRSPNNAMISSLFQYGLFTNTVESETDKTLYILSDFAKALKQNSLNFNDESSENARFISYEQLSPLNFVELATNSEVDEMLNEIFSN